MDNHRCRVSRVSFISFDTLASRVTRDGRSLRGRKYKHGRTKFRRETRSRLDVAKVEEGGYVAVDSDGYRLVKTRG